LGDERKPGADDPDAEEVEDSGSREASLLAVSVVRSDDTAVVRLDGELDCATAPKLSVVLTRLLVGPQGPPTTIVADAEKLRFVDIAGLQPLVEARRKLPAGCRLEVRNAAPHTVRVIRVLGLDDMLGLPR
jgi:anti-anti-sigma factor